MKRLLLLVVISAMLAPTVIHAATPSSRNTVSLEDMLLLARSDISDSTVLMFLDYRVLNFELDATALAKLREAGASDEVIQYLLELEATAEVAAIIEGPPADYGSPNYPPYYYYASPRFRSALYPLGFYDYRYYGLGYTYSSYRPYYGGVYGGGHIDGITLGHGSSVSHSTGPGGHQNAGQYQAGHQNSSLEHNSRSLGGHSYSRAGTHSTNTHGGSRSAGHRAATSRGHSSGGYSGRHGGGRSGGHRGGHSGGRH